MRKLSDKTGKFLLNYSNLFWGPLLSGHKNRVKVATRTHSNDGRVVLQFTRHTPS